MNREPRGSDVREAQGADVAGDAVVLMTLRGAGHASSAAIHGQPALAGGHPAKLGPAHEKSGLGGTSDPRAGEVADPGALQETAGPSGFSKLSKARHSDAAMAVDRRARQQALPRCVGRSAADLSRSPETARSVKFACHVVLDITRGMRWPSARRHRTTVRSTSWCGRSERTRSRSASGPSPCSRPDAVSTPRTRRRSARWYPR